PIQRAVAASYLWHDHRRKAQPQVAAAAGPRQARRPAEGDRRTQGTRADPLWRLGAEGPLHRFLICGRDDGSDGLELGLMHLEVGERDLEDRRRDQAAARPADEIADDV